MNVSVVILTKNEERNIVRCLQALQRFDDIHVIDSGSDDKTPELAVKFKAKVHYRIFDTFSGQRNFAHEHCNLKYDWVLHIDADEVVTTDLIEEIEKITSSKHNFDCFEIPSRLMFLDTFLKFASEYPVYQVRLMKKGIRFEEVGHGQKEIAAVDRIGRLKFNYLHYNFSHGISNWLVRHVGYAKKEAAEILDKKLSINKVKFNNITRIKFRRILKQCFNYLPILLRPFIKFSYLYFFRLGFLDGRAGFIFCLLQFTYELMIGIFYYMMKFGNR
jgi:glycosyltransferase involved in cell wall biosynthesis